MFLMDPPRVSSIRTGGGGGSLIGLVRRKFSNFPPKIDRKGTEINKRKNKGVHRREIKFNLIKKGNIEADTTRRGLERTKERVCVGWETKWRKRWRGRKGKQR